MTSARDPVQPALRPVQRDAISSEVSRQLLNYLFESKVQAGHRLPSERELAETLAVGRSAVREALRVLAFLGLVDIRPGSGTFLLPPGSEILPRVVEWGLLVGERLTTDMIEARGLIEVSIAGLAAERATEADIDDLRALVARMETDEVEQFIETDIAFHLRVARSSGNMALSDMLSALQSLLRAWISRAVSVGHLSSICQDHAAILLAIEAGDASGAKRAMQAHLTAAQVLLEQSLAESGQPE